MPVIGITFPTAFQDEALLVLGIIVKIVAILVPLLLSLSFLALAFDLIPHLPYDSTERFHDTRALPSRALNVLFLGQNYHLVHHLWNSVPWYKYQQVFNETKDDLAAVGARVDWGD